MPIAPTYPGIYIEEIPSGVRTITGVATSVTAFLGRTKWGPVNEPVSVDSYAEFERKFGGLTLDLPLTYAVRDFFLNGGSRAVIVRLYAASASDAGIAQVSVLGGGSSSSSSSAGASLQLEASSPGAWGNDLTVEVEDAGAVADDVAALFGAATTDFFHLKVTYLASDPDRSQTEVFNNLTATSGSSRRFDTVLARESQFVRALLDDDGEPLTLGRPTSGSGTFLGGSDSEPLEATDFDEPGRKEGLSALDTWLAKGDIFNLLCLPDVPEDLRVDVYTTALAFCAERRAFLIADPPESWSGLSAVEFAKAGPSSLGLRGPAARNAAVFFPRVMMSNPLRQNQLEPFVPCGIVAGVMARTDTERGVWKAPAGIDGALLGVKDLTVRLSDAENGTLNQVGVNCLRAFPVFGSVVWGSRTARGADVLGDEYKYVPVRRLALFIEETLFRNLKWVVFEPNDEPLWAQIRLNVGAFMHDLFRQHAFQGKTPQEAYLVKCDRETTTQTDINRGIVNVLVGFAPLKPAEFVIIKLQQLAGQVQA